MPWQHLVADVGGEIDPRTGLPAYHEVVVTVPRQSGKTTEVLAWEVQRALGWGRVQRIVYSAQTGLDARKKLIEDQVPILEPRKAKLGISRILTGMGQEAVVWRNGSRLVLMASTEDAGHGKTVHLGVKDELFADVDNRRDQALEPAMSTVADAQLLTASTMGTDDSVPLNQLVDRGRQAVHEDRRDGIAYFEWSADPDSDLEDEDEWWQFMPALGLTIPIGAIRRAKELLSPGDFRRAYGNLRTKADERLIPAPVWARVCDPNAQPEGELAFAVDVNDERSAAAIVAGAGRVLELVEHRDGMGWLLKRIAELKDTWGAACPWLYDETGPVASLRPKLQKLRLNLKPVPARELVDACGSFYDDVADANFTVRTHPSLDAAVAGAQRRMVGDTWKWARKDGTVDISPLVAATLALWACGAPPLDPALNVW